MCGTLLEIPELASLVHGAWRNGAGSLEARTENTFGFGSAGFAAVTT
jgi:hypothetical protein